LLRNRLVFEWILVAFLGAGLAAFLAYADLTAKIDNLFYDMASVKWAPPPPDDILIVEIDNATLARVGTFPWQRDVHARFLDQLSKAQPAVVAYDVLFIEPGEARTDAAFATALARGVPTILPVLYEVPGPDGAADRLSKPVFPAAALGHVNVIFDEDGLVRRAQLETRTTSGAFPHLMEQVFRRVRHAPSPAYADQLSETKRGGSLTALESAGTVMVPMARAGSFRHVSFGAVLRGEIPERFLRGKIILVGAVADGMGDRFSVASEAGSTMSGIEIQANLLSSLLANQFVHPVTRWTKTALSVVPVLLLMIGFWRFRPNTNLAVSIAMLFALLMLSLAALAFAGVWFPPTSALFGIAFIYPLWGWRRLEALSGFIGRQAALLNDPSATAPRSASYSALDQIGAQASALQFMIVEMNDRKTFMADIISGLPDAICVIDPDQRVVLSNPPARALFGPGAEGQLLPSLMDVAGFKNASNGHETALPDGRSFLYRFVSFGADTSGKLGSIALFADVTVLRELAQEREEMLQFLSHDMRSPQTAILTLLGATQNGVPDPETAQRIDGYARQTLRLADDFVQLARLKSIDVLRDEVDIAGVFAEAIDAVWPLAKARQIKVVSTGLDEPVFMRGDASSLGRALTNLLDNAIKYGNFGGSVQCAMTPNQVLVQDSTDLWVEISVSDDGPGLPPERAKNIFARFGDRGTTRGLGSGLGLAFVNDVVARHDGKITYEAAAQGGAHFTLLFRQEA
jgi:CHASE2 domain-containing sensor protein/two-component sensor histidine kinase